jgi:hypothetical protein
MKNEKERNKEIKRKKGEIDLMARTTDNLSYA